MEEADFFYMPLYVNLLVWPVFGWADGPWWGGVWGAPSVFSVPCCMTRSLTLFRTLIIGLAALHDAAGV